MVEKIEDPHSGDLLAIIVRHNFSEPGVHFFTANDLSQQLAFMRHPKGKVISPHVHVPVCREVHFTQETLIIRKGQLQVDIYSDSKEFLFTGVLRAGDVILLIRGGHGFRVIEDLEMFEVKQGPYAGDKDKIRFESDIKTIQKAETTL